MASQALVSMNDNPAQAEKRARLWELVQTAVAPVLTDLNATIAERIRRRKPIEKKWLEDIRQYRGQYDDSVLNTLKKDAERSAIFINITRPKTNAWRARMADMLFPNDERNWGIDPTPVPSLTREAKEALKLAEAKAAQAQAMMEQHNASIDQGGQGIPGAATQVNALFAEAATFEQAEAELQKQVEEARKRCQAMERTIDDQLTEARYAAVARDVIEDACKIGLGYLKGPIVTGRRKQVWEVDAATGNARLVDDSGISPGVRRVDPWSFFPDPDADCVHDGQGTFERHLPNRKALKKMAREYGFDPACMRKLLEEGPQGFGTASSDISYLAELRSIESPGEDSTTFGTINNRWIVWEYHGPLETDQIAKMIRAMGRFEDAERFEKKADPLAEHTVRVFFCGDKLLKIDEDYLLDSGDSLYSAFAFERAEAGIYGAVGVPRLMRNEQMMLNSAVRMMMDNAALATGPQIVVDKSAVEPENGNWKLTPRKVWQRTQTAAMGEKNPNRPFETFDIPMNQELLANIVALAVKFVDEAVSMPLIAQGEQGAHVTQTAGGMSMLFNSANVVFRRVVKNWDDDVTAGLIQRFFDFNMQFSDDPSIKGDMKVEARGTSVLLVREIQSERLMAILGQWSLHPLMGPAVKAYHCMKLVLQAMNINPNDVLVGEEEYLAKMQAMSQASQGQGEDGAGAAEQLRMQIAQVEQEGRKEVALINQQTEFAKLAQARDIPLHTLP